MIRFKNVVAVSLCIMMLALSGCGGPQTPVNSGEASVSGKTEVSSGTEEFEPFIRMDRDDPEAWKGE